MEIAKTFIGLHLFIISYMEDNAILLDSIIRNFKIKSNILYKFLRSKPCSVNFKYVFATVISCINHVPVFF